MAKASKGRKRRGTYGIGTVRRLPSGKYQARWIDAAGAYHPAPTTYANEADAWAWLSARAGGYISTPSTRTRKGMTFADFAESWLDTRRNGSGRPLAPRTQAHYRSILARTLVPAFGPMRLDSITPGDVKRWEASLDPDNPVWNSHADQLLRSLMASAVDLELIGATPCKGKGRRARSKPRPAILTPEQLDIALAATPERYRAAILVMVWLGLRSGEMRALQRRDFRVTAKGATLAIERAVVRVGGENFVGRTKSEAGHRVLHVMPSLVPEIEAQIARYAEPGREGLIFPAVQGGHMHPSTMQKAFKAAVTAADRPEVRIHDLRHHAATRLAQMGATTAEIMTFLGDSSVQAAMRYQHAEDARMSALADSMDRLIGGGEKRAPRKATSGKATPQPGSERGPRRGH